MKRQIRYGMWESNSSSSHCMIVTKNDHLITNDEIVNAWKDLTDDKEYFYINKEGQWDIWDDDLCFGRGFKICSSLADKACYAIAEYCGENSELTDEEKGQKLDEIHDILFSVCPEMYDINLPTKHETAYVDLEGNDLDSDDVMTNWEVSEESAMHHFYKRDGKIHPAKPLGSWSIPYAGYIDHQSQGLLTQFLIEEGITLKEFLLNKKYVAIEDSDEVQYMDSLKASGLFNKDNIVKEYTAWQAYQDSKKLDPEFQKWLDEQEDLKEKDSNEETD